MRWNFNPPNKVAATGLSPSNRKLERQTDRAEESVFGGSEKGRAHREKVEK